MKLTFCHGLEVAFIDTAAKSSWVDENWFVRKGGTIIPPVNNMRTTGADGREFEVAGEGTLSFQLFGRLFRDIRVRFMKRLPSNVLIGLKFWY
jgi:hypothetical protein